jgi:hypothetical protein
LIDEVGLAENTIGRKYRVAGQAGGNRRVELQYPVIEGIRDEDVALRIHSDPATAREKRCHAQSAGSGRSRVGIRALVAEVPTEAGLAENVVRRGIAGRTGGSRIAAASGERIKICQHSTVQSVGNVKVTGRGIDADSLRAAQPYVAGGAILAGAAVASRGGETRLSEHQVRRQPVLARACRAACITQPRVGGVGSVVFNHSIVFEIRDVEIAASVNRDAGRIAQVRSAG